MRRWTSIVVLLLVILGGIAIGVSAYNAGVNHGLVQAGHAQVVRVVGHGFGFPFGSGFPSLFCSRSQCWEPGNRMGTGTRTQNAEPGTQNDTFLFKFSSHPPISPLQTRYTRDP